MFPYWLFLLLPVLSSLLWLKRQWSFVECCLIILFLTFFIGLRHEVGGDWFNYLPYLDRVRDISFIDLITREWGDPGFNFLNWIFATYPWGIYAVNTVSALIFAIGLVYFCRAQPLPRLALCLSIPYLVTVVAMGYSRQGVAIGLIMPGLIALERGHLRPFLLSIALASTFHSTSLLMLGFLIPSIPGRSIQTRALRLLLFLVVACVLVYTFLLSRVDSLLTGYINVEYQSEGAAIRVLMNLVPGVILLSSVKRFRFTQQQERVWTSMAWMSFACFVALIVLPSNTTAVDRIALYDIPLQIVIGSRLPLTHLFRLSSTTLFFTVIGACILTHFVWLNFATHATRWLPYMNIAFF